MGTVYNLSDRKQKGEERTGSPVDDENTVYTLTCNCGSDNLRMSISKKYGVYTVCNSCGNDSTLLDAVSALEQSISHIK